MLKCINLVTIWRETKILVIIKNQNISIVITIGLCLVHIKFLQSIY